MVHEKNLKFLFIWINDDFLKNYIILEEKEFIRLLKEMSDTERAHFIHSIVNFSAYMKAANSCRNIKEAQEIWTNLVLILLFGLIEKIMCKKDELCFNYVEKNIKRCTSATETRKILDELSEKYGATRKVHKFFLNYILESEKDLIIKTLKENPYFDNITTAKDPIKKFIDWIIDCRGKFVHELGLNGLSESNKTRYIEPDENGDLHSGNAKWYPTVDINQLRNCNEIT